ncbi:hypothetical protein E4T56_gene10587 [Termitomyces sp. T112]|nr:hypothetical protein E4T56_gene10587 [Termitomyces sp. T112]
MAPLRAKFHSYAVLLLCTLTFIRRSTECVSRFTSPFHILFIHTTLHVRLLPLRCFQSSSIFCVTYILSLALPPLPVSVLFALYCV